MENKVTLRAVCEEAQRRGFKFITIPEVGITQELGQFIEELDDDSTDTADYSIFGNFIICMSDAWKEDAEILELIP